MDLLSLVKNRQSARVYTDKKVEIEKINQILEIARLAPSACNSQPWKMVVVNSQDKLDGLKKCLISGSVNAFLSNVNTFICMVEEPAVLRKGVTVPSDYYTEYDIGELLAYITLAAENVGVSSCIIGRVDTEKIVSVLDLNENEKCKIVVALGYSDTPKREKIRKSSDETIKFI